MDQNLTEFNDRKQHYITRRQAIKLGGIVAAGLIFSRPIIDTILPTPVFAQYGENGDGEPSGCTPGKWKNNLGIWTISTGTTLETVFGPFAGMDPDILAATNNGLDSLLVALGYVGGTGVAGKARNLLRIGSAAHLNELVFGAAYDPDLGTFTSVAAYVHDALVSGSENIMNDRKNVLDAANNANCPSFLTDGPDG